MEDSKLKNMVVLKNLPSNIVDEAIIVLKSNKKVKKEVLVMIMENYSIFLHFELDLCINIQ